ncbi:hypothetical protein [Halobacillus sp. BBL2006]|uniref:hypothetical protein n=1 Tax=Halobacillus sp. BBL2006 TaxID=1543706 RepID=UPI000542C82B|nr:hypothetical protein [Halobacillus sp. BBL2006]KHE67090.1 hypothetical protein LD39_19355 [Halobacillus sp. BBL2006]
MKKLIIVVLSLGLAAAVGITGVYAQGNQNELPSTNMNQRMDMNDMHQMMKGPNGFINFGQMKNIMEDMHPNLTKQEIKEMYAAMHGTNGAEPSAQFENCMHE